MKKITLLLSLLLFFCHAFATNYYVSALTGSDSYDGSFATPFANIQKASDLTNPGDTVFVMEGIYSIPSNFHDIVRIVRSGTAAQPIVYKNYPGAAPQIDFSVWAGISTIGASYIEIDGFKVRGNNRNITLTDATNQPTGCANTAGSPSSIYNGNGISADNNSHHITIRNCEVFECGGAGIGSGASDYITIENNLVYNNSWYTRYGTSGISINESFNFDNNTADFKIIIRNNIVYGNRLYVPWRSGTTCQGITDGNGIILDINRNSGYLGKFLIENNIVYRNGGRGIHVFKTDNATVRNNTSFKNCASPELSDGEITVMNASNCRVFNNVMYAREGKKLSSILSVTNLVENNNLMYGSGTFGFFSSRDIFANPNFIDTAANNFQLADISPGIDAGNDTAGNYAIKDIVGTTRPFRVLPDMGAYEFIGVLPVLTKFTDGNLALLRIGTGTILNTGSAATVAAMGNPAQLVEYATDGTGTGVVFNMPTTGTDKIVIDGFTSSYAGQLALSADGRYLSTIGYNGDAANDFTVLRATDKIVARMDFAGTLDVSTRFPNTGTGAAFAATSIRGAASDNGSIFWATANGVFRNITANSTTFSTVPGGSLTVRSVSRFGGNSFIIDQADNSVKMHNGSTATALAGIPTGGTARQTVLAFDVDPAIGWNGTVYDVVYVSVVNAATTVGIQKYYFDNSSNTWLDGGMFNSTTGGATTIGYYSITGKVVSGKPEIYGIKGVAENNALIKLVDNSGRTGNWLTGTGGSATAATLIASAGTKYLFRGVAFTPTKYGNNPPQAVTVLPVRLLSFNAFLVADDVMLQWKTTYESNLQQYIIERSSNRIDFKELGRVAPQNNINGASYSFNDRNITEGIYFYRLKTLDLDGKTSYSKIIVIKKSNKQKNSIYVFPNPAKEQVSVSYPAAANKTALVVVDMAGKILISRNILSGSTQSSIDVSQLSSGQYNVIITSEHEKMVTVFIK